MPSFVRRLSTEPLVHFLLFGALLVGLDRAAAPTGDRPDSIVVSAEQREELAARFAALRDRPPSEAELAAEVRRFVDEEILYREGVRRGLERGDPVVRERIARKMAAVVRDGIVIGAPTDAELATWFAAHRERFSKQTRYDFTHVFVAGRDDEAERRARGLLEALEAGQSPAGMGDRFQGGRRYRQRRLEQLTAAFGPEFTEGFAELPLERWTLRPSRHGWHVLKLDARHASHQAELAEVKQDVRAAWEAEQRDARFERAMEELRARWSD